MLKVEKFLVISPKIWIKKAIRGWSPKCRIRKAMIMVSFDDFSAPSESRMFIFWLFHQFTTQSYAYAILTLLTMD